MLDSLKKSTKSHCQHGSESWKENHIFDHFSFFHFFYCCHFNHNYFTIDYIRFNCGTLKQIPIKLFKQLCKHSWKLCKCFLIYIHIHLPKFFCSSFIFQTLHSFFFTSQNENILFLISLFIPRNSQCFS